MSRKYEKVQEMLPEVKRLTDEGYTHRKVAEKLGLGSGKVVERLLYRERKKEVQGIPKQRGRKPVKTLAEWRRRSRNAKLNTTAPTAIAESIYG